MACLGRAHVEKEPLTVLVRELMGRVRNVVLIKCTLDLGKPKKGWDFEREGTWDGEKWVSLFTSNLGLRWTIPVTARRVPSK